MTVKTFAAIDVGSFELELGIFEISASAGIREIDHVRHALALGKDTYNDGRLRDLRRVGRGRIGNRRLLQGFDATRGE